MISTLKFESSRIFSRRNIMIFIFLLLISLYFVFLGIYDYKKVQENKKDFKILERQKIERFVNYGQYAAVGFRIMFQPSPLAVFFRNGYISKDLKTNIDATEIINIYDLKKGENIFSNTGNVNDFGGIIYLFASLWMLYLGFDTFRGRENFEFFGRGYLFKTICSRLVLMDIMLAVLMGIPLGVALLMGIPFSGSDLNTFLHFCIFSLLFLDLLFLGGILIPLLTKFKKISLSLTLIFWFLVTLILPELVNTGIQRMATQIPSTEKLNLEKLQIMLGMEKNAKRTLREFMRDSTGNTEEVKQKAAQIISEFMNSGYIENIRKESQFHDQVKVAAAAFENFSSFFPGNYYLLLNSEISGKGYNDYIRFVDYILHLRDRFIRFYVHKRYAAGDPGIESFVQANENIYAAGAALPASFNKGTGILIGYLLLTILLIVVARQRNKPLRAVKSPGITEEDVQKGKILFCLTAKEKKDLLIAALRGPADSLLEPYSQEAFVFNVTVECFLNYACSQKRVEKSRALEFLESFQFSDLVYRWHRRLWELDEEAFKKLICAVVLAGADERVIVNDFIKGLSRNFEERFLQLLADLSAAGKKIIYISTEPYSPAPLQPGLSSEKKEKIRPYLLNPLKVSLR